MSHFSGSVTCGRTLGAGTFLHLHPYEADIILTVHTLRTQKNNLSSVENQQLLCVATVVTFILLSFVVSPNIILCG